MPVQDLTPQLRTRLSRVERVVGIFVSLATLLLLAGFGYYVYHTGARKGWWKFKARYHTFVESGAGLDIGSNVRLLGFDVGRITKVEAMSPEFVLEQLLGGGGYGGVYLEFYVLDPYQGYIWTDSKVRVVSGDFLGNRVLEIVPGGNSLVTDSNAVVRATYKLEEGKAFVFNDKSGAYEPFEERPKGYWLPALESPAITDRLESLANQVQGALPSILDLTNRVNLVLSNVAGMTAEAESLLIQTRPLLTNITFISGNLTNPNGSLGEWLIPTNLSVQLEQTLSSANTTLTNASQTLASTDTNLTMIATNLDVTLVNLANITSNLNQQVQSNTNLLEGISDLVRNADEMVQGLKKHWLLRSAFKNKPKEEEPGDGGGRERSEQNRSGPPKAGKWR